MFSPRARGCSRLLDVHEVKVNVFPACAGMFLAFELHVLQGQGFPRVRGDVPHIAYQTHCLDGFSPRARGCSLAIGLAKGLVDVFPACAGMFPPEMTNPDSMLRFPRVRGDVPLPSHTLLWNPMFSPRARGCSALACTSIQKLIVFPACAGMFRSTPICCTTSPRFPRVRGDVPD